jgi:Group II intron, maturase-specific domain
VHRRIRSTLTDLAAWINPILRGWVQYYGAFYPTALHSLLRRINTYLIRFLQKKYRRLGSFPGRWPAGGASSTSNPGCSRTGHRPPRPGDDDDKSRMNREGHVRIRGSRG